jgi:hypothetical protein
MKPDSIQFLLLGKCLKILGKDCMAFSGSIWRTRAFENPTKLGRVLDEIAAMHRQGKAVKNPGAYADHLWKNWQ